MKKIVISAFLALLGTAGLASYVSAQNTPAAPAAPPLTAPEMEQARLTFNTNCAACHGANGGGGDRAPSLLDNPHLRTLDTDGIANIIKTGQGAMPAFASLPQADLTRIARWLHQQNSSALSAAPPEQIAAGGDYFFGAGGCAGCHMVRGVGGSNGPDLSNVGARSTREEMEKWLDNPTAMAASKPPANCSLNSSCADFPGTIQNVTLKNGTHLRGFVRNRTENNMALQSLDGKFHLLDADAISDVERETQSYMPAAKLAGNQRRDILAYLSSLGGINPGPVTASVPPPSSADIAAVMQPKSGDWTNYYGQFNGNRYSPLKQINTTNAKNLQPQWLFTPGGTGLQGTPIVLDGVMYVTGGPQTCALDAKTGMRIWCTPRTNGMGVPAAGRARGGAGAGATPAPTGPNRGLAILGDRLYYTSDDAYIVCLNRLTGAVMWTEPLAERGAEGKFYTSAAPLVVDDLVISGIAGGDTPMRGFLVAYHADTGKEAWRLYTIPKPGEPLSETWVGNALPTGGGATWVTGSYDSETQTLFWAVGNPFPDTDAEQRQGTNLYTNSVLALDVKTGKIKWHYQFTPYDTHDWDANEPMLLVDTIWKGKPRKLLVTAQRSGVLYVLDRTNGQFLLAKPFVQKLSWATGFRADGSPIMAPGNTPTKEGTKTCPPVRGATNWYSSSFNPATKLLYVMAAEDCGLYRNAGRIYGPNPDPSNPGTRQVRALNIETGAIVWDKLLVGPQESNYTGILSTAGGILFHGETGGNFAAVDVKTGKTLYTFRGNASFRSSPMTYMVDGRQYVATMNGTNIIVFALGYK